MKTTTCQQYSAMLSPTEQYPTRMRCATCGQTRAAHATKLGARQKAALRELRKTIQTVQTVQDLLLNPKNQHSHRREAVISVLTKALAETAARKRR